MSAVYVETPIYDDMLDESIPGDTMRWWQLWSVWSDLGLPDRQPRPPRIRLVHTNPKADRIADIIAYTDNL